MGHHNHHFAGDVFAHAGVWGPPTSAANFCEEDYAVTIFIAEFVNTLSNLAYVYFAVKYPGGAGQWTSVTSHFDSLSAALLLVGITSTAFHGTLRQTPQLTDDLSMLLLAGALMQKLYCHGWPSGISRLITASIWLPISMITAVYVRSGDLLIHVYTFGTMVALIGLRLIYLIYLQRRNEREIAKLISCFWKGAAYLIVAFSVWNIDLEICSQLRGLRQQVGLPWAWLLELHGWWHILTAIGASGFIELTRTLCDDQDGGRVWSSDKQHSSGSSAQKEYALIQRFFCCGMPGKSKADLDRIGASR